MQKPVQVVFRGMKPSEALDARARERVAHLEKLCPRMIGCHVVIDSPHRHHQRGNEFEVRLRITVPGDELVINGNAVDLSRGGMRISTSTDLPAGQPIVLRFALPPGTRELLVRAKIALTFYDAASKRYAA